MERTLRQWGGLAVRGGRCVNGGGAMRYDSGYRGGYGRANQERDIVNRNFRGHPVDDVHGTEPGGRSGWRGDRGDFVTQPAEYRGQHHLVDPRENMFPDRGERDFLGHSYGPAAYDNFPRGLYDQDHMQMGRDRMRGYDREMGRTHRYGGGASRGYDRGFGGGMRGYDRSMRGGMERMRPGEPRYGADYVVRPTGRAGGPMMGHAPPREPLRPLGEPTWTNRWSRRG